MEKSQTTLMKMLKIGGLILGWLILVCMALWASMAIFYSNLPAGIRPIAAVLFAIGSLTAFVLVRPRRREVLSFFVIFAVPLPRSRATA